MVLLMVGREVHIRGRVYTGISRSSWKRIADLMQRLWSESKVDLMMIQSGFLYRLV